MNVLPSARVVASILATVLATHAHAQSTELVVDTFSGWGGSGVNRGGSIGQVITPETDVVLDSFAFYVGDGGQVVSVSAYILPWANYYPITAPLLYQSDVLQTTGDPVYGGVEPLTFYPSVRLTGGVQYLVFLSGPNQTGGVPFSLILAYNSGRDSYPGGFGTSSCSFECLQTNSWGTYDPTFDWAFRAEMTPFPDKLAVTIDIKPGDSSNAVNLGSAGVIPVAILSTTSFDALEVDPGSISLAGATVKVVGKGGRYLSHQEDVNGDGLMDLVSQVHTVQFMIEPGTSAAILEAQTFDGRRIRGQDTVMIVP